MLNGDLAKTNYFQNEQLVGGAKFCSNNVLAVHNVEKSVKECQLIRSYIAELAMYKQSLFNILLINTNRNELISCDFSP